MAKSNANAKPKPVGNCVACSKTLFKGDMVYYLEDSLARRFCSEVCIEDYFKLMVQELLEELRSLRSNKDIPEKNYHDYHGHFQDAAEQPDEVWLEDDPKGGQRHILIKQFQASDESFWYIIIGTLLEGQPSFVQIAFPTSDEKLMKHYRRGRFQPRLLPDPEEHTSEGSEDELSVMGEDPEEDDLDREKLKKEIIQEMLNHRGKEDIPVKEFKEYQHFEEQTLDFPDEIYEWNNPSGVKLLTYVSTFGESHFLPEFKEGVSEAVELSRPVQEMKVLTFVVICQVLENEEPLEEDWEEAVAVPVASFPTLDNHLANCYRKGKRLDLGDQVH